MVSKIYLLRLTKMGKNDNFIRTVNCFVVVKTDINNHKKPNENETKGQNKKKRKEKIKISSIQGKGPQTLLSGGHACFFFGASTSRFAPTVVSHSVDLYLDRTIRTKSV